MFEGRFSLQFTATFFGKESPVTFTKDVYVGTVPVSKREMKSCIAGIYNQPYLLDSVEQLGAQPAKSKSQLSLTHIIAQAASTQVRREKVSFQPNQKSKSITKLNFPYFGWNPAQRAHEGTGPKNIDGSNACVDVDVLSGIHIQMAFLLSLGTL